MRRKQLLSMFMLSMGVALLVAAMVAGGAMSATRHAQSGGTLNVGVFGGITFLDPQLAYDTGSWTVLENTELLLIRYADSNTGKSPLHLEGATAFPSITNSGKTYVWHIKPGLEFSNGDPVNANSFKIAFQRLLSPCMFEGGIGTADFFDKLIVGGVAFNTGGCPGGTPNVPNLQGVQASGNTLTIHLTKPASYFTAAMAMIWFSAMPTGIGYDSDTQDAGASDFFASAGPYHVTFADPNGNIVVKLHPNLHYTGNRASNSDEIDVTAYGSQTTCYNDTTNGAASEVDECGLTATLAGSASNLPGGASTVTGVANASPGGNTQFHVEQTGCVDYITLDTQRAPTDNVAVRKALEYTIDRTGILNILGAYAGGLHGQILTPPIPGYKKINILPPHSDFNTAATKGGAAIHNITLNVWHSQSGARTQQAALMEQEINNFSAAKNLNITVNDETIDSTTYFTQLGNKQTATVGTQGQPGFNLARAGWCADYYDPFDYLNVLFNGQGINPQGNNDLSYINISGLNGRLNKAAVMSGSARKAAYASIDSDLITKYAPTIPYDLIGARIVVSSNIGNWTYDEFQGSPSWNALTVN